MIIKEIKTVIAQLSKEEREILSKAKAILLQLSKEVSKLDELPMEEEDFDLLNNIYGYSEEIQEKLYWKEED